MNLITTRSVKENRPFSHRFAAVAWMLKRTDKEAMIASSRVWDEPERLVTARDGKTLPMCSSIAYRLERLKLG